MTMTTDAQSVGKVLAAYLQAVDAGQKPTRERLLADHPELANELRMFFSAEAQFQDACLSLRALLGTSHAAPSAAAGDTLSVSPVGREDAPSRERLPPSPDYEILEELGRGGMGVVYKARQTKLKRFVALKMILAGGHARAQELARFKTEAEAIARLQHPNIVQVYEVGEHEGRPFFSLEYCGGGSLQRKLAGTPLPPKEAAGLVETLARAMHAAHAKGVIHRDLKPANVLLAEDGTAKITDFGLARNLEEAGQTLSGTVVGTPSYMAPEQASGQAYEVGPTADVYALGAILYECLTGRPPFKAATPLETILQVQRDEPVPPARLQSGTPRDLETICLKCLAKEPHKRYRSALELAEDLERFRSDRPILARPVGRLERARRWCRRNPWLAGLTAAVVLLLVTVAAGSTVAALWLSEALSDAEANLRRAEGAEKDGKRKLLQAYAAQGHAGRNSRRLGQRFDSLKSLEKAVALARELKLPPAEFHELRNEAIACLALPDLRRLQAGSCWGRGAAFSFDDTFEHFAITDFQGNVTVHRYADGKEIVRRKTFPVREVWPFLSRDGRFLVVWGGGSEQQLKCWKLDAGPTPLLELPRVTCSHLSPDRPQLAVGRRDGAVEVYDLASGRQLRQLKTAGVPEQVVLHPDGARVAFSTGVTVTVARLDTGAKEANLPQRSVAQRLAWHPDGRTLAVACADYKIYLWDVPARKQTVVIEGHKNGGIELVFNRRGNLLASWGWAYDLRLSDPRSGRTVLTAPGVLLANHFSRDDRRVVATIGAEGIWELAAEREYRTLVRDPIHGPGIYDVPSISPDGRLLAVGMRDGVGLWQLDSGQPLAVLPTGYAPFALFEPSGALLTSGQTGLQRWPVGARADGSWRIGPPARLASLRPGGQLARSRDGRVLASAQFQGAVVLHRDRLDAPIRLGPHADVRYIAVSPDGKWVVTGTHNGTAAKVWEADTGKLVQTLLPDHSSGRVEFSPDGKWLATGGRIRLWAVGSWQPHAAPPEGLQAFAIAPDGKVMAAHVGPKKGLLALFALPGGRELARLEDPNQDGANNLVFSPDGTKLVTVNNDASQTIHVWDLRLIRRQLKAMGLDWDAAEYGPEPDAAPRPPRFPRAEVLRGDG
jgi:WD40 repeat protein/tRNA A-37 threonylcarbamoyl transferase component Bud32